MSHPEGRLARGVNEKSPPGFKGTVKALKRHREIDNPFALGWWMKKRGYRSHYTAKGRKKRESFRGLALGEASELVARSGADFADKLADLLKSRGWYVHTPNQMVAPGQPVLFVASPNYHHFDYSLEVLRQFRKAVRDENSEEASRLLLVLREMVEKGMIVVVTQEWGKPDWYNVADQLRAHGVNLRFSQERGPDSFFAVEGIRRGRGDQDRKSAAF